MIDSLWAIEAGLKAELGRRNAESGEELAFGAGGVRLEADFTIGKRDELVDKKERGPKDRR